MTTDTIALLPMLPGHEPVAGHGWTTGIRPFGGTIVRPLSDGVLVHLGLPFATPDADLHDAARRCMERPPQRIWMFPDSAETGGETVQDLQTMTASVGRWVEAGSGKRTSPLEEIGLSADEARAWQRDMASGDQGRVTAALALLDQHMLGRDPALVQALIARMLAK